MPSDMWTSTVSSNLARLTCLSRATARFSGAGPSLASRGPFLVGGGGWSALHGQPQAAGRPLDDLGGVVEVAGVQVGQLPLRDLAHLGRRHLEALVLARPLGLLLGRDDLAALLLLQRD